MLIEIQGVVRCHYCAKKYGCALSADFGLDNDIFKMTPHQVSLIQGKAVVIGGKKIVYVCRPCLRSEHRCEHGAYWALCPDCGNLNEDKEER